MKIKVKIWFSKFAFTCSNLYRSNEDERAARIKASQALRHPERDPRALSAARRPSFPLHAASAVGGDSGVVELTWTPPLTRRVFPGGGDGNVGSDETVEDGGACLEVYNSSHGGHRTRWGVSLLV